MATMEAMATPPEPHAVPHIRTFHARHGRVSHAMRDAIETLGPARRFDSRRDTRCDTGRPLVLEVGSGAGHAAIAFALAHRHIDLLAVDVHKPGIARLLVEADALGLDNVYVERADAVELLTDRIPSRSLAGIHLFFPDPWPKNRHHKRRFVRPDVLDLLADRMVGGADLRIATDVSDYASWARRQLAAHPAFEPHPMSSDGATDRPAWRPDTGYEERGRRAGRTATELHYRRRPDAL